jgi:glucokinase
MLLAGDVGGTKTLLGLYERDARRPRTVAVRAFATFDSPGLPVMVEEFLSSPPARGAVIEAAVIGVAGPVRDQVAELTNVPWNVSGRSLVDRLGIPHVVLLNDVEAMGYSVGALEPHERVVLQAGVPEPDGNGAVLAIGTGVGMAILHRVDGRLVPVPSEGGHSDFAARTDREMSLVRALRPKFGRVAVEQVVAGPGLAAIARFTHDGVCPGWPSDVPPYDEPALVTRAALEGACPACREAMDMFIAAMGAVAGNLALLAVATGGLFIGGGVPAKIMPALASRAFIDNFLAKAPVEPLLHTFPVTAVTLAEAGLLGAAVYASRL